MIVIISLIISIGKNFHPDYAKPNGPIRKFIGQFGRLGARLVLFG